MPEVKTEVMLLSMTPDPGLLLEDIASDSYQTQRFFAEQHPELVRFASGRTVPLDQLGLGAYTPKVGEILPGYVKDDMRVAEIIPASWKRVVKFILRIGHHALLRNIKASFRLKNITRKAALHILRYEFCNFNMQSQKYQPQDGFNYLLPTEEDVGPIAPVARRRIEFYMKQAQAAYEDLRSLGLDPEWSRCPYPNNISQTMTISTNFEQWRHIFDCLCDDDYVAEDQVVMMQCLRILKSKAPEFFEDFRVSETGKSAKRVLSKYSRNKKVNWSLTPQEKTELGLYVPDPVPGTETDIP